MFADLEITSVHVTGHVRTTDLLEGLKNNMRLSGAFVHCRFDPSLSGRYFTFSENNTRADGNAAKKSQYAVGTIRMRAPFTYTMELLNIRDGNQTCIGVIGIEKALETRGEGDLWTQGTVCAITYGSFYNKGQSLNNEEGQTMACRTGDSVRLTVDMNLKTMKCEKIGDEKQVLTRKFDDLAPVLLPAIQINGGEVKVKFL